MCHQDIEGIESTVVVEMPCFDHARGGDKAEGTVAWVALPVGYPLVEQARADLSKKVDLHSSMVEVRSYIC